MSENGIITTLYLTFAHNQIAIAFFAGILLSIILSLKFPKRSNISLIIAFSLLLLGFEYAKHISDPLLEQTTASLSIDGRIGRADRAISYVISILIPMILYLGGWGLIFLSIISFNLNITKLSKSHNQNGSIN